MAYASTSNLLVQYDKLVYANYWLKFYEQGTVTPLSMATSIVADTLLVKAPLDSEGFILTGISGPRFIPFMQGYYDAWLFPTEVEADANDTTNAVQIADNINTAFVIEDQKDSVASAIADLTILPGRTIYTASYRSGWAALNQGPTGGAKYDVVTLTEFTAITGGVPDEFGDHTMLNSNILMLDKSDNVNLYQYGAVGDGVDDSLPIQAIVNAGILDINVPAVSFSATNISIDVTKSRGIRFIGKAVSDVFSNGSLFTNNGTTPMFTTNGIGSLSLMEFTHLRFNQLNSSSGHIIAPNTANSIVNLKIQDFYFNLSNPASSFLKIDGGNPAIYKIKDFGGTNANGASVPIFDIACAAGLNIFGIKFEDASFNSNVTAVAPMIKIENKSGGQESFGVTIDNVNFETPGGGAVELLSINRSVIRTSSIADLSPSIPTQPLIWIKKSTVPGSLSVLDALIESCTLIGGDASFPTVKLDALGGQGGLMIISSKITYLDGQIGIPVILGSSSVSNFVGTTKPVWVHTSGRITGVQGLSTTNIDSRNLTGTAVFPGANNVNITFVIPEIDTDYQVIATLDADGTVRITDKLTTGFTIRSNIVASSDNVDWVLIR